MKLEIEEAQDRFEEIMDAFESGELEHVTLMRSGVPAAVLKPICDESEARTAHPA